MGLDLQRIRNIGIAAHIDAGKTTTTERILYYARRTHRMGDVDDGTTTTDYDEQEQKRGITIYSAAVSLPWRDYTINLIDTPGHVDFTAEVERSLRVLDGMVAVFDAKEGVEAQSETVWRQADKYEVPRICFINKMDRVGADFERSVESIHEMLHVRPIVLQIPIGSGNEFKGLVDLIEFKAVYYKTDALGSTFDVVEIPDDMVETASRYRHMLIECAAETSDALLEQYLGDEQIDAGALNGAIREATLHRTLYPVLCGSALRYIGVQRMLDAVCAYLPSPLDMPPVAARDGRRPEQERVLHCDRKAPAAALVFKVIAEKPVDLYFMRVYSGTIKPNSRMLNTVTGEKENITRVLRMFAKRRDVLDEGEAGDIVAVVGPKSTLTGHSLCDPSHPVVLEAIDFPETVISVSIEPRSSKDKDKLDGSLAALARQDPTLAVATDSETGQTLLSGMGELHLEVAVQRLRADMNVDAVVGRPRVSYRETVGAAAQAEGRFVRHFGGRNHFAVVRLLLEPVTRSAGSSRIEIANTIPPGAIDPLFIAAAESGVREAAQSGVLGGYPVIDWKGTLVAAQQHEHDSSEMAFESAGRVAFLETVKLASPLLLEPIMEVEVVTPDEYFGSLMADLNARKATIRDTVRRGNDHVVRAEVPLAQMFGYVTRLRSLSQGRATSSMVPSHYAPVAADQMKILVG